MAQCDLCISPKMNKPKVEKIKGNGGIVNMYRDSLKIVIKL